MVHWKKSRWPVAMGIGLVAGLVLSGFWPYTPLHAVSTDRADTYAMATGPVDTEVEAVYFLDFLTGDLGALVLGKQPGVWTGFFRTNVSADLAVDPQKNPEVPDGHRHGRPAAGRRLAQQPSSAVCYVAEITSGKVAAYAIPWSPLDVRRRPAAERAAASGGRPPVSASAAGAGPGHRTQLPSNAKGEGRGTKRKQ